MATKKHITIANEDNYKTHNEKLAYLNGFEDGLNRGLSIAGFGKKKV